MKYFYFVSFCALDSDKTGVASLTVERCKPFKNAQDIEELYEEIRTNYNHEKITILNIQLLHKE